MSDLTLSVQNLSKSFRISHLSGGLGGYRTLHEELTTLPRRMINRLRGNGKSTSETFWALRNVSFDVNAGEVLGIIGSNGAGKSTLLKILNRITEPTLGGVDIYGRVGALLEVGTGFHPELTGRENIFLNGAILGMTRAEIKRKFDEIVAFAEVERFLDTPVKRYSSGMYVRLAFAVAAHLDPEILLIDEVLAVGDAEFQKKCLAKMEDVATKEGRTVIFVSHNMDAVCHLCSRCVLLRNGEIEKTGSASEVVANYLGGEQQELPTIEFPAIDSDASFRFAGLYRSEQEAANSFSVNEPILLNCSFNVRRQIEGLQLSFSVFNFKGERIFYSSVSMAKPAISVEAPGEHNITAVIPAHLLLPGRYSITIALHTPKTKLYDVRKHALGFRILATMLDRYDGFSGDDLGHVYANVKWQRANERGARSAISETVSVSAAS
ncbi:MAG TPA: ABC transporter ATP-binding protein [Chthoniobacterales bacterium]|nr:ABC transporter ATP-binding protein [Chthoniobacterales bacterium]